MKTDDISLYRTLQFPALSVALILSLAAVPTQRCSAQTQASAPPTVAALHNSDSGETGHAGGATDDATAKTAPVPVTPDPEISPAVAKQLAAMQAEIEQLKTELKGRSATETAPPSPAGSAIPAPAPEIRSAEGTPSAAPVGPPAQEARTGVPEKPSACRTFCLRRLDMAERHCAQQRCGVGFEILHPGNPIRYQLCQEFNHPRDDTMGGSSEIFRSNEIQVEQISFGGDFHWQNVRGRVLTMNGMFGVTTPRNDASPGTRPMGPSWSVQIRFRSLWRVSLERKSRAQCSTREFSFPTSVCSATTISITGRTNRPTSHRTRPGSSTDVRIQWFPTDKLKIEPWIINGWQSYGRLGSKPGLGGTDFVSPEALAFARLQQLRHGRRRCSVTVTATLAASRIHTDDSVEVKYYDHPDEDFSTRWPSLLPANWDASTAEVEALSAHRVGRSITT